LHSAFSFSPSNRSICVAINYRLALYSNLISFIPSYCAIDAMLSSVHKRGSLPKLSTSKEITRRDSLSSSRTGDSGYNSELDITFSPLDFIDSDQRTLRFALGNPIANHH
jgi:hypothetical protein